MPEQNPQNPYAKFLLEKLRKTGSRAVVLSWEATWQIIDELERQDRAINQLGTPA